MFDFLKNRTFRVSSKRTKRDKETFLCDVMAKSRRAAIFAATQSMGYINPPNDLILTAKLKF